MPKFAVHCTKLATSRVVLEVSAESLEDARYAVEISSDPHAEFEEVGEYDEGYYDVTVVSIEFVSHQLAVKESQG